MNPRHSAPKADALPDCATPRWDRLGMSLVRVPLWLYWVAPVRLPSPAVRVERDTRAHGAGGWIRTNVALASDLQSDGFNHSPTPAKVFYKFWISFYQKSIEQLLCLHCSKCSFCFFFPDLKETFFIFHNA